MPDRVNNTKGKELSLRRFYAVVMDALTHFNNDDGWAMASHVALSILMALFPFMIFGTALASFLGANAYAETASHLIFDTWPESIAAPISREVVNVLTVERGGLLTLSVLAAAFFSANGVEALRVSLNRAYRVTETRAWYVTRAQSLGFVVIAVLVIMAISFLLVLAPLGLRLARQFAPWMEAIISLVDNWRILIAALVLVIGLVFSHLWLPAGRRRLFDVIPGIGVTLVFWMAGALMFASYLQEFATYVLDLCRSRLDHDCPGLSLHYRRHFHSRRGDQCCNSQRARTCQNGAGHRPRQG